MCSVSMHDMTHLAGLLISMRANYLCMTTGRNATHFRTGQIDTMLKTSTSQPITSSHEFSMTDNMHRVKDHDKSLLIRAMA